MENTARDGSRRTHRQVTGDANSKIQQAKRRQEGSRGLEDGTWTGWRTEQEVGSLSRPQLDSHLLEGT